MKRGTSDNKVDFMRKRDAKNPPPPPNPAVQEPRSVKVPDGQIAVMLTLMTDSDRKTSEAREAQARVNEYAAQIILMSGLKPEGEYRVNWDKKIVERTS